VIPGLSVPGLYVTGLYLTLGGGLLAVLGRCVGPLSPRAAAALLLLPLCFTGGALIAGDSYGGAALAFDSEPLASYRADYGMEGPHDPALADVHGVVIPWRAAVRWAWRNGEWPLWNPFAGCGEPLAGSAQSAPYSWIELATLLAPLPQSFTLSVSLVFLLAAAGAFLLAGHLGCREVAAFFAAASFAFCNYVVFWNAWPLGATVAWLPLVVLVAWRLIAAPGPGRAVVLGVVLAQVLLAGHPESALHVVVIGALAGLVELVGAVGAGRRRDVARALGWAGAGGALALGLAALFLLPVADALLQSRQWSARAGTHAVIHQTDWQYTRGALLADVAHFAFGLPGRGESPERPPWLIPGSSLYLGSLVLPLALFGLARSRARQRWLLAGLLLFGLLAGAKVPGFFPLLGRLPLFEVSLNERLVFVAAFALALLAALGVEAALAVDRPRRLGAWLAGALAAYGALFAWLIPRLVEVGIPHAVVVAQSLAAVLPLALGALALVVPLRLERAGVARACVLLGLLLAARVVEAGWMYDRTPAAAFFPRVEPLDRLAALDERGDLEVRDQPYRVVGYGRTLLPNSATLYGLEDARTYNALHLKRFAETWPLWSEPVMSFWYLELTDIASPFLAFLNARFLIAPRTMAFDRPWSRDGGARGIRLFSNNRVLPRAFVPERVLRAGSATETIAAMSRESDFAARAWIEHDEVPVAGADNGGGSVVARRRGSGYRLDVELERAAWIVVSETAWRGWRATARGETPGESLSESPGENLGEDSAELMALEIAFANHAFLGIRAPAGRSTIDLAFRPRSHQAGLAISAISGLLALLLAGMARRGARRSRRPGSPAPGGAAAAKASTAS
jgi:hypothetical protein